MVAGTGPIRGAYRYLSAWVRAPFDGKDAAASARRIALIGYTVVAIEILAICRFNGTTAVGVVSTLDLSDLVVTVPATSLMPWLFGFAIMVVGFRFILFIEDKKSTQASTASLGARLGLQLVQLVAILLCLGFALFAPITFLLPLALSFVVAGFQALFRKPGHKSPSVLRFFEGLWQGNRTEDQAIVLSQHKVHAVASWSLLVLFLVGVGLTIQDPRPWVSAESLTLASTSAPVSKFTYTKTVGGTMESHLDGWVFGDDDGRTRVLTYGGRRLIYVETSTIAARQVCEGRRRDYLRSLYDLMVSGSTYPDCQEG